MMDIQTIQSEDTTVGKLFNDFYIVPSFQREYVWEEEQVTELLEDIHTEFSSTDHDRDSEYFIGSIVVCTRPDGVYEIIDGQQRMTTVYLFLCAVRDHLQDAGADPIGALGKQIAATDVDSEGNDIFRYRVTLQYDDSCGLLERIAKGLATEPGISETTRSVVNILNAYCQIRDFLQREFVEDINSLRRFYAYFTKNVKLIQIKTISITHALKVFETINDRGLGLDSMDLLKNLMFMQARTEDFDQLKDKWKELVDILYVSGRKPLRFLRYFIFSQYGVDRLREEQIYDWFVKNEEDCGYKTNPFAFVNQLLESAKAYALFIAGKNVDQTLNRYLINIRYLSGAARQHLILLLAAQHLPRDCFTELCKNLENLFFAYIITREPTREFERTFAQWAPELRKINNQEELKSFLDKRFDPVKQNLAARYNLSFQQLNESSLQKYRVRYVLAKLTQHINERAWGSSSIEADLETFINSGIEVEHILPQKPTPEVYSSFDKQEEIEKYIHILGNLTMVEKTINCSIGRGLFEDKKSAYRQSRFLLTKSLGEKVVVGADTAVNRAVESLLTFDKWNSVSIEQRQEMLTTLATQVWDMPTEKTEQ